MRKYMLVASLATLSATLPSPANASPQFASTTQMTYTAQATNTSSGLSTLSTWTDPGEPFSKPVVLTKIVFGFNPGTKFDTAALPVCKATDTQVRALGVKACPRNTIVGHGDTAAIAAAGIPLTTVVTFFNAKKQIIVVIELNGKKLTFFRDDVAPGTITANLEIPAGIALTRLHVEFPRHTLRARRAHGKTKARKKRSYMTTPAACPPTKLWTTITTFSYADGSAQTLAGSTPCS